MIILDNLIIELNNESLFGCVGVSVDSPLSFVHKAHCFLGILPLSFLYVLQAVTICYRKILTQDFNIVYWLTSIIVNVLFYRQNCFCLVCIFQFFWKFVHHKIRVFISKMEKFKLKIYIWSWGVCFFFFLLLALLFINYRLGHFSFCHPFLIHFRKQIRFEFIISLFKIWNKPINDVLKSNIFNHIIWRLQKHVGILHTEGFLNEKQVTIRKINKKWKKGRDLVRFFSKI